MIGNGDFALPYAGRAVSGKRGIRFSADGHGNVRAARIRGKRGGMKLASTGDGSENVSSEIQEENIWKH